MTDRICLHGHRVRDAAATHCPLCGVTMESSRPVGSPSSARGQGQAAPTARSAGARRSWNWLTVGLLMCVVASLFAFSGDDDAADVVGSVIGAIGGIAVLIGVIGIGVFNGMMDVSDVKRSEPSSDDS